jgi:hypothetical protein
MIFLSTPYPVGELLSFKSLNEFDDKLSVEIADGRTVLTPLAWYPRLYHATKAERADWTIFEDSEGRDIIFWER